MAGEKITPISSGLYAPRGKSVSGDVHAGAPPATRNRHCQPHARTGGGVDPVTLVVTDPVWRS